MPMTYEENERVKQIKAWKFGGQKEWKFAGMKIWNEICLVFKGEPHLIEQGHRTFHSIF